MALVAHHDQGSTCPWPTLSASPVPAIGPSVGSAYDPLERTSTSCAKTEVAHRRGSWRDVDAVKIATAQWAEW